jgi:hypothetical protein
MAATTASRGIDRRTVKPALIVLGLALVLGVIVPLINSETDYRHQIHRGEVVQLADGLTLVPRPGWALTSGALVGRTRAPVGNTATTDLVAGGIKLQVQVAPFASTPSALLTRINKINSDLGSDRASTGRYRVTTRQGIRGLAEDFVGVKKQGSIAAFVFRARGQLSRQGVEVVVSGPNGQIARERDHIVAMIRSIRVGS